MTQCTHAKQLSVSATYAKEQAIPQAVNTIEDATIRQLAISQLKQRSCNCSMLFNGKEYGFVQAEEKPNKDFVVSGDNSIYINFGTAEKSTQKTIMDKSYIVDATFTMPKWNVHNNITQVINGKKCIKATLQTDSKTIAWYCPDIPCQMGPNGYGGLPGLIMKLESESATYILIDFKKSDTLQNIKCNQKGEKVTEETFVKIRSQKLKNMGVEGSGVHIIRM